MKLTQDEVRAAVRELHAMKMNPGEGSLEFSERINTAVDKIEAGGWKLGLSLGSVWRKQARRGNHHLLKKPRLQYLVVAAFYNVDNHFDYVHYYCNEADTKGQAMLLIKTLPAPNAMPLTQTELAV